MKALSLWQPWSSAIAYGHKTVETRGWPTRHRGPVAIHAARRWTDVEKDCALHFAIQTDDQRLVAPPLGAIVAVANIVGCRESSWFDGRIGNIERMLGDYGEGRYGFILEDVVALRHPVPYRGMQGMFTVPDDIIEAALAETRAAIGK